MLFADLLSLHFVTFLMFFILVGLSLIFSNLFCINRLVLRLLCGFCACWYIYICIYIYIYIVSCTDHTHEGRGSGYTSPVSWASGSAEAP